MEFFIARHPVFNRKRQVFAYKLQLCRGLRDLYYGQYREPEDAETLYRRLCFSGLDEASSKPMAILDFSEELIETVVSILPRKLVIIEYGGAGKSEHTELKEIRRIQTYGYKVIYDATLAPAGCVADGRRSEARLFRAKRANAARAHGGIFEEARFFCRRSRHMGGL